MAKVFAGRKPRAAKHGVLPSLAGVRIVHDGIRFRPLVTDTIKIFARPSDKRCNGVVLADRLEPIPPVLFIFGPGDAIGGMAPERSLVQAVGVLRITEDDSGKLSRENQVWSRYGPIGSQGSNQRMSGVRPLWLPHHCAYTQDRVTTYPMKSTKIIRNTAREVHLENAGRPSYHCVDV